MFSGKKIKIIFNFFIQNEHSQCLIHGSVNNEQKNWCQSLYKRKAGGFLLYGRALGLSHSEAEDVLQETFLALLRMSQPPREPEHYGLRSFRNRALNYRRSLWRRLAREWESAQWFEKTGDESAAEQEAMRHLTSLPAEQREVIVLKIWNELTFEEIGELLEISPNTAAGRYRYGLNKLKVLMKDKTYERDGFIGETIAIMDATPPIG